METTFKGTAMNETYVKRIVADLQSGAMRPPTDKPYQIATVENKVYLLGRDGKTGHVAFIGEDGTLGLWSTFQPTSKDNDKERLDTFTPELVIVYDPSGSAPTKEYYLWLASPLTIVHQPASDSIFSHIYTT